MWVDCVCHIKIVGGKMAGKIIGSCNQFVMIDFLCKQSINPLLVIKFIYSRSDGGMKRRKKGMFENF